MTIEYIGGKFIIRCSRDLDKEFNTKRSDYIISFSPSYNGIYTKK